MLTVGLTGGIACGKSQTLKEFNELGVYTVDADEIAHQVILPGQPAYDRILSTFGSDILAADQSIDRTKLGKLVFSDQESRENLNRIVHPFIFQEENRLISVFKAEKHPRSPVIMVDAALMIETGSYRRYDSVVVVHCRPEIQLGRLISRDGFSKEEALRRIGSQMPLEEKIKHARYAIDNSGRLSELREQVHSIFADLVKRSSPDYA